MKNNAFTLMRTIVVFAIVALIGLVAVSCETEARVDCEFVSCECARCPGTACGCASQALPRLLDEMNDDMVRITAAAFPSGVGITLTQDFYISRYVVTQELFQAVMGTNPSRLHGGGPGTDRRPAPGDIQGRRPVETVNWYHAIAFANRVSLLKDLTPVYTLTPNPSGFVPGNADSWLFANVPVGNNASWNQVTVNPDANGFRLPTEAEWEFAARATSAAQWSFGDNAAELGHYAWFGISWANGGRTREVGQNNPNLWGLHDMHGNVWEWVWDRYDSTGMSHPSPPSLVPNPALTDPPPTPAPPAYIWPSGGHRVARGGGWASTPEETASAYRNSFLPHDRGSALGFRIVRNIPPANDP